MTTISDERLAEMLADAISERDRPIIGDGSLYDFAPAELVDALTHYQSLRAQGGVRVKPLEWREEGKGWFRAPSELGAYSITHYAGMKSEGFKLEYGGGFTSYFSSLEEAEVAAQADYERRIMGALE